MLAVEKLMPESLSSFRFRGTTLMDEEVHTRLENIIIHKVCTVQTEDVDTSEVFQWRSKWSRRMIAKVREKLVTSESWTSHVKQGDRTASCLHRNWQRHLEGRNRSKLEHTGGEGGKDASRGWESSWQIGNGKQGGNGSEKDGKGDSRRFWTCAK